ncbi:MAG: hypothetical protein AAFU80_01695 [Pseudomonadota bacterium]
MSKIVTPMDLAMAGLRVWTFQAQQAALATLTMSEAAEGFVQSATSLPRMRSKEDADTRGA